MPLTKPSLANVSPGQPVTAQAWNAIVNAINGLYDFVSAFGSATAEVEISPSSARAGAVVVAVPADGAPVSAIPPRAGETSHTLTGLRDGEWTLYVSAPGFNDLQKSFTVPLGDPLAVNLTPNTKVMPDLLGDSAARAVSQLASEHIQLDSIYDVTGDSVARNPLPAEHLTSRVLFQFPLPGERVVAATAKVRLVLSAEPEVAQMTVVPALKGYTYSELVKVLDDAGLKLGNVSYLTK